MPANYHELYFPVLVQIILAAAVAAGLVGGGLLLGKRVRNPAKDMPYESGMTPTGSARERFTVKYFLVAMGFILFDIEAIAYPWAVVYRELARQSRMFPFVEMLLFIVLVLFRFLLHLEKRCPGLVSGSHAGFPRGPRLQAAVDQFSARGITLTEEKPAQLIEK